MILAHRPEQVALTWGLSRVPWNPAPHCAWGGLIGLPGAEAQDHLASVHAGTSDGSSRWRSARRESGRRPQLRQPTGGTRGS